jgi:hypothetical protein
VASVPITITGVLFDKYARTTQLITLMGEANLTGLGVGGGPIMPQPPGIWGGGNEPFPTPPIAAPLPPWGNIPSIPPPSEGEKPPPEEGGWGYWGDPVNAWVYKPGPGQASPK